jgi:peptidylglycine monooxygenase
VTKIIVGTGEYKYEVKGSFGNTCKNIKISRVSHVSVNSKDHVYFFQRNNPPILVFNKKGELLNYWGKNLLIDGHGIFISKKDDVFLVARGVHEILKFSSEGKLLLRIGQRENPSWQKPFNHPTDIAVSIQGDVYVTDGYGNACVHKFSSEGKHLLTWGKPGSGPGEFHTPHGIWVDEQDNVYVADRDNNRVQIFSSEGEFLSEWRDFFHPMDIYFDSNNTVYITDQTPRFSVLNTEGKILARGFSPGVCHGIWGDSVGNLFLANLDNGIIKLLKR